MYGKLKGYEFYNQRIKLTFEKGAALLVIKDEGAMEILTPFKSHETTEEEVCDVLIRRERDCLIIQTARLKAVIYDNFVIDFYDSQTDEILYKNFKGQKIAYLAKTHSIDVLAQYEVESPKMTYHLNVMKTLNGEQCLYEMEPNTTH